MGIEPTRPAWKAGILPLNYTRISKDADYFNIKGVLCQPLFRLLFLKHGDKKKRNEGKAVCCLSFCFCGRFVNRPYNALRSTALTAPSPLSASQTFPHTVGNHPRGGREDCGGGKPPALPGFIWFSRNFAGDS